MTTRYRLSSHQRHQHLNFAFVDGDHQTDFALHKHDFSELFLVVEGSGKHLVAGFEYPLNTGDVFVINGETEHGFKDVCGLKLINLMFDASAPFFELPSMRVLPGYQTLFKIEPLVRQTTEYRAKLTLDHQQLIFIEQMLESIRSEYQGALPGFEVMISSLMQQLIITLARIYAQQQHDAPKTTLALSRAMVFIEQNYTRSDLIPEQIAQAAFISQRQLERLFKHYLNTSPNHYLRQLQLNYAHTLIHDEKLHSVQKISESCGFSDSNYFSKCYKQRFLLTPREDIKKAATMSG
ncbi:helix-turn-helix domain-containing protein [Vibrio sinaloensis]|uniref:helix-turn-helix domain-containing protein n=1 Tax=Photobacterium sp. (strain ATCC 43367) TaxID=379097 RepID=UPI0022B0629F|nr:helix-turn-helix domain-containing protein [Vibrio sinaloensis]MCZ4294670.1 helix-turn-helix domain-containing protein [Vibrio sinaloensis]